MRNILTILISLLSFVAVSAQTQQHSIIIDAESLAPVQTDIMSGVAIDKIGLDTSRRPCARIKMHVNRMTREEIDGIVVQPIGGSVVVMKQIVAAEGNGLIVELTAKQPTRFYLHHDKYGDSNEVSLNLEGNKEYRLSAELNISYPIVIATNVIDAEVYIDGMYKGRSDSSYTLTVNDITPGTHKLKVQSGSSIAEQNIEVSSTAIYFRLDVNVASSRPQYVVFSVTPNDAIVVVDNKNCVPDEDGIVQLTLNNGSYNYHISANSYHDERGTFVVSGSKVEKNIELRPAHGWVEIGSASHLKGASIYINGDYIGQAPIKSDKLASGTYKVKIIKELYLPYEGEITIKDNETLKFNPSLTDNFAIVTITAGDGASIYVNNTYKGKSSWTGNLEAGAYIFEARKEGHRTTTMSRNITTQPQKQSITLDAPTPIIGYLNLTSTPKMATVNIDGKDVGKTPLMYNIVVGKHDVMIKAKGYRTNKQSVTVTEGKTINLNISLQKGSDNTKKNVIEYVMPDRKMEISDAYSKFGANIKSHTWNSATGIGVITFESNVTEIGYKAFWKCGSLTSVTIPDSVTTIGDSTFSDCSSLTNVTIPDSVTTIGNYTFYSCRSLTSVTIPDSVTTIGYGTFYGCSSLTSVTIPDSVTTIGNSAFAFCYDLTSVTIPDSVTTIAKEAFYDCNSLTSVTIPDSVTTIGGGVFWGCSSLTSVTIPDSVTTIGDYAFSSCHSLTSVTIPDSVTAIGRSAFDGCSSLTSVTIPDGVTAIGDSAFSGCHSLTSVTIPDSVTTIGTWAFSHCSRLTSVTIPDSVTKIGYWAFAHCSSLTSVTIPDSVTAIGTGAFEDCYSLKSVTIGDSVTTIGGDAFNGCSSLVSVYCKATTPPSLGDDVFKKSASSRKIYVPMQSVKQYKKAKGWKRIKGYNF